MRVRAFKFLCLCAAASLVAFSLGIWVARGGSPQKLGPSGDAQGVAHPKSVRLILPGTLDGQAVPGHGSGLTDRRRDLSPIYPTSPGSHEEQAVPELAASTPPTAPRGDEVSDVNATQASIIAEGEGEAQGWNVETRLDSPVDDDVRSWHERPILRHMAPRPRHLRGSYARRPSYLAMRRFRPINPFGALARLSLSDHGR